jgi:hypothetical protein
MWSTSVVGNGKGLGGACGSRAPITARRGCEDGDKGLMGSSLGGSGCKVRVAWNFDTMSLPKSRVGQLGRTRKECVKSVSASMQVKGKVIKGWGGVPSTLTMEVKEGLVGPQNSGKAEKVALVSMRRERRLPSMRAVTLGSCEVMVIGPGSPGLCQS